MSYKNKYTFLKEFWLFVRMVHKYVEFKTMSTSTHTPTGDKIWTTLFFL